MEIIGSMKNDSFLVQALVTVSIAVFFLFLNEMLFNRLYKEHGLLHLRFLKRFLRDAILIVGVLLLVAEFWGMTKLTNFIAGSVAIFSAIVGFAIQNTLKDFFAGLMLSIYRPFDIGDRLLLDFAKKHAWWRTLPCAIPCLRPWMA